MINSLRWLTALPMLCLRGSLNDVFIILDVWHGEHHFLYLLSSPMVRLKDIEESRYSKWMVFIN